MTNTMVFELDETDWRLITELQTNARLTYVDLGRRIGLSRPAVAERVRQLEESGILIGYRAVLDPKALGFGILAFVRISAYGDVLTKITAIVGETPEILECHRGTGSDCFILKVVATSLTHLERVLDRLNPFGQVTTSIVLSSVLTERNLTNTIP